MQVNCGSRKDWNFCGNAQPDGATRIWTFLLTRVCLNTHSPSELKYTQSQFELLRQI